MQQWMRRNWFTVFTMACIASVCLSAYSFAVEAGKSPKDDSDPPEGRSLMWARVDAATGCEYLEGMRGGLTPRLDAQGRHRGCR